MVATTIRDVSDDVVYASMTSVDDDAVEGDPSCVRATLHVSGWKMARVEGGIAITYITQVDLGGYIPNWLIRQIQTQVPLCAGKVADYIRDHGFPPNLRVCEGATFAGEELTHEEDKKVQYTVEVTSATPELRLEIDLSHVMFATHINAKIHTLNGEAQVDVQQEKRRVVVTAKQAVDKVTLTLTNTAA